MQLVTVRTPQGTRAARREGDQLILLDVPDVTQLLQSRDWRLAATATGDVLDWATADLACVVPMPEKVVCVGLNYHSHAQETGHPVPDHPAIFAKYGRALIGANDDIVLPVNSQKVDWEAELAIVIGHEVRYADEQTARAAIAGYTVANDVSMRDWQVRTSEWLQGKTFESSTPVGPVLVTLDEFEDPDNLHLVAEVDGRQVQEAWTSDLIFGPAAVVSYISQIITLVPGDLILTGTPGGIGARQNPPAFLRPGQVLSTRIDGIGELRNTCVSPV